MPSKTSIALLIALAIGAVPAFGQTFVFHFRGDQEVPPVPSVATGGCMIDLNQPMAQASIQTRR